MCVGINIYGGNTLNLRTFGPSIKGFVQIVREKHEPALGRAVVGSPTMDASRSRSRHFAALTTLLSRGRRPAGITLATLLALAGRWHWTFDLFANFPLYFAVAMWA